MVSMVGHEKRIVNRNEHHLLVISAPLASVPSPAITAIRGYAGELT
jgi:hypothetical protein